MLLSERVKVVGSMCLDLFWLFCCMLLSWERDGVEDLTKKMQDERGGGRKVGGRERI